jgi:hypothetical protein
MFGSLKNALEGCRCRSDKDVKFVVQWFQQQLREFFVKRDPPVGISMGCLPQ